MCSLSFQLLQASKLWSFAWILNHLHCSVHEYFFPPENEIQKIWFLNSGYQGLTDWTSVSTILYASEFPGKKQEEDV